MQEKAALEAELQREPTVSELAARLDISPEETAQLITVSMPVLSLTADNEHAQRQLDVPVPPPDSALCDLLSLRAVLGTLGERDSALIRLRYFDGLTQSKTAEKLGMSQVQVSPGKGDSADAAGKDAGIKNGTKTS